MERIGQFVGEPAAWGLIHKGLDGGNQGAEAGKPYCIVGPQAGLVETGGFAEDIVAAAMGIAGQVTQELELAKDGEIGSGAESLFEFGKCRDFLTQQVFAEGLGIEREWTHNVIVPTAGAPQSEL